MKKPVLTGLLIVAAIIVFAAGFGASTLLNINKAKGNGKKYSLLARRVQNNTQGSNRVNFASLRGDLQDYVASLKEQGGDVSVYFESLSTGSSIYVNENIEYVAASLMKVPVAMTLYKFAQMNNLSLDDKVTLREEWLDDDYGALYQKGAGHILTIREAAKLMLRDSDNTALNLVYAHVDPDFMMGEDAVTSFLDMEFAATEDRRALITAKNYSSVLKCLYFSCYNSLEHSQEILTYLTESTFNDRLPLYIPKEVTIAHKIGTFSDDYQSDCGIFYLENRNYLLCVMVKGIDPAASYIIADMSQMVYLFMQNKAQVGQGETID